MADSFEELCKKANGRGWLILNCYQYSNLHWRCNMQYRTKTGATEAVFTEFADGKTAAEALAATMADMDARERKLPPQSKGQTINARQQSLLLAALDRWHTAHRIWGERHAGTRGHIGADDL